MSARAWFRRLSHADVGEHLYNGLPWRFAGRRSPEHRASPRLGEHGPAILAQTLGLSNIEIEMLTESGVTGAVLAKKNEPART